MAPGRSIALILAALAVAAASPAVPQADAPLCLECLSLRVEAPVIVRGPFPDELDSPFTALRLPDGSLRGFSSNAAVYAIDGPSLDAMSGKRRTVFEPGAPGSESDCGRWLNGLVESGGTLFGLIHREKSCDYDKGQTHKSMALGRSDDGGMSWSETGTIIAGPDAATSGKGTGIGDCSWVDGHDGHRYAYCLRLLDWKTIVARAPATDLAPGQWRNYFEGGWSEDAIGGKAASLGFLGTAAGYFETLDRVGLIAVDPWFGGVRLALSRDKFTFETFAEPLIPIDGGDWARPAVTDLIAYPALLDPETGATDLGEDFLLSYTYLAPGATFADRYLVLQRVGLREDAAPPGIQAGIALTRWQNEARGATRSSTGPLIPSPGLRQDRKLGYLLTKAPADVPSLKLEECEARNGGYRLVADGTCAPRGDRRLRTAGWVLADEREGTMPLYRCNDGKAEFTSNDAACESQGTVIERLGFALR